MKTALITGASKRVGRSLSLALAKAGYGVAIHYNESGKDAEALAQDIIAQGGQAKTLSANLAEASDTEKLVEQAISAFGPLTCLINNASRFDFDKGNSFSSAGWDIQMAVNLRAPALLTRDFAHHLGKENKGCVINILDSVVAQPDAAFFSYTISKAALAVHTEIAAQAYAPHVRVCGIAPGLTLPSGVQSEESFKEVHSKTLLGQGNTVADIAEAALYLLSAKNVTGQIIYVDGGERYYAEHGLQDLINEE